MMDNNKLDGRLKPRVGNCATRYYGKCNGPDCEGCDKYKPLVPVSFEASNTSEVIPIPGGLINDVPHSHNDNKSLDVHTRLFQEILGELRILNSKVKVDLPENEVGKRFNKLQKDCLEILESYTKDLFGRTEEGQKQTKEMYIKRMIELVYDYIGNYKE